MPHGPPHGPGTTAHHEPRGTPSHEQSASTKSRSTKSPPVGCTLAPGTMLKSIQPAWLLYGAACCKRLLTSLQDAGDLSLVHTDSQSQIRESQIIGSVVAGPPCRPRYFKGALFATIKSNPLARAMVDSGHHCWWRLCSALFTAGRVVHTHSAQQPAFTLRVTRVSP